MDIPQAGSDMPGNFDLSMGEPVSGGGPQYVTPDVGMDIPQTGPDTSGNFDLSMGESVGNNAPTSQHFAPFSGESDTSYDNVGVSGNAEYSSAAQPQIASSVVDLSQPNIPATDAGYSQVPLSSPGSNASESSDHDVGYVPSPAYVDHSSPIAEDSHPGYSQNDEPVDAGHSAPHSSSALSYDSMDAAAAYNQALFQSFMPGYDKPVTAIDGSGRSEGHFEVRHADGSGTMFFDSTRYAEPRGDHKTFEDISGGKWYAVSGQPAVERRPVYENGKPVYEGENVKTISVETVRYRNLPSRHASPVSRRQRDSKNPKKK